ncbi:MAG: acyl carrier protein [Candidatus Sumerlaeota bacterium]|nr:acyl carrier protein [Candidatus Sumerlaeota bacterium]
MGDAEASLVMGSGHSAFYVLAGIALAIACLFWLLDTLHAKRRMAGRPSLTPEEFGAAFYPGDRSTIAARVRRILDQQSPINLAKVVPSDTLIGDLRIDALDSIALAAILLVVEEEFRIRIEPERVQQIRTIGDLVDCVAAGLAAGGPQ